LGHDPHLTKDHRYLLKHGGGSGGGGDGGGSGSGKKVEAFSNCREWLVLL